MQIRSERSPLRIREIAQALTGPGCKLLQTGQDVTVKCQTARIQLLAGSIDVEIYESDCAIANTLTTLRVRSWLETLVQSYGPFQAQFEGEWRDLGELMHSGNPP